MYLKFTYKYEEHCFHSSYILNYSADTKMSKFGNDIVILAEVLSESHVGLVIKWINISSHELELISMSLPSKWYSRYLQSKPIISKKN